MHWDSLEFLTMLSPGDLIEAADPLTGHAWYGPVDMIIPEQGKLWMYAALGERKLIDVEIHTISRGAS